MLVFAVTRVIFIPQGEFVAYGALTLALLQLGKVPGTIWLLLALALVAALLDLVDAVRRGLPAAAMVRGLVPHARRAGRRRRGDVVGGAAQAAPARRRAC